MTRKKKLSLCICITSVVAGRHFLSLKTKVTSSIWNSISFFLSNGKTGQLIYGFMGESFLLGMEKLGLLLME